MEASIDYTSMNYSLEKVIYRLVRVQRWENLVSSSYMDAKAAEFLTQSIRSSRLDASEGLPVLKGRIEDRSFLSSALLFAFFGLHSALEG